MGNKQSLSVALVENLQREDLNPMDEAEAYGRLVSEFNFSQADIAKKVSKDRSTIANMLRLLELPKEIQKSLQKGDLSTGHGRALLSIADKNKQMAIFHEVLKNKLSVRDIEVLIYGAPKQKEGGKRSRGKSILDQLLKTESFNNPGGG